MVEIVDKETAAGVPGVPSGKNPVAPVAPGNPSGEAPRLLGDKDAVAKSVIAAGGNKGGRPREDGLVPGSPEALEADRKKNSESKARSRANLRLRQQSTQLHPPLPNAASPVAAPQTPAPDAGLVALVEVGVWSAADFNFIVPDCISFAETWRVKTKTRKAIDGHLPPAVAEQIGASFAFPVETKSSLRASSPDSLAKLFNELRVPVALKPAISAVPALAYIIARDSQLDAKLDKMIAEETARRTKAEAKP